MTANKTCAAGYKNPHGREFSNWTDGSQWPARYARKNLDGSLGEYSLFAPLINRFRYLTNTFLKTCTIS